MALHFLNEEASSFFQNDNFIYRILTLDRFLELKDGNLAFISPLKWTDPYEKAFLEVNYNHEGEIFRHPLRPEGRKKRLFAQCWTGSKQTEALWRGFAKNNDGVMIKFRTQVLLNILQDISNNSRYDVYIGKVVYQDSQNLYDMKTNIDLWQDLRERRLTDNVISLLLKKREAFNFEHEYRIMVIKRYGHNFKDITIFPVDELLNQTEYVKFDPRMGETLYEFIRASLAVQFTQTDFHKSRLYSDPLKTLYFGQRAPNEVNDEPIND